MMYLFDNFGMRWNIFKIIKHILFFYSIYWRSWWWKIWNNIC